MRAESAVDQNGGNSTGVAATGVQDALMLGRVVVTEPEFGTLSLYIKDGEGIGATFFREHDGAKFGAVRSVRAWYDGPGEFQGWAYVNPDPDRAIVFRFVAQPQDSVPEPWVSIRFQGQHVSVSLTLSRRHRVEDGAWVAFHATRWAAGDGRKERVAATAIFPLDIQHPAIVARLVTEGTLTAVEHSDIMSALITALEAGESSLGGRMRRDWANALEAIAGQQGVPEDLRALARVQRTRLSQPPEKNASVRVELSGGRQRVEQHREVVGRLPSHLGVFHTWLDI